MIPKESRPGTCKSVHKAEVGAPGPQVATSALRHYDQKQAKGEKKRQMRSRWAAVSRKANRGTYEVCEIPVSPANSPTGDLVLLSIHSTGHSGHPDRVLYVLHMLAQVGAPDGNTGASVYRPSQRLHLFQDMDCSPLPTSQRLAAWKGSPRLPPLGLLDPQHPNCPSKGSGKEGTSQHFNTPSR